MYPENVELNDKTISKLNQTLKRAYVEIVAEIEDATDFGVANRKAILSQIENILTDLGTNVDQFIKEELPGMYELGADEAIKQLKNVGATVSVSEGFNRVHKMAIAALIDDTSRAFGEGLTGVARSANVLLGKATREQMTFKMAKGLTAGESLQDVRKVIKGTLQEQGLDALKDKSGRSWTLDRYSEMLFRTKAVEARNRGLINRVVENGFDLVQVSSHLTSCPICAPWQGKILSITGQSRGYPTVAEAEADGLFHPNCRHAINTINPKLASRTLAYNASLAGYGKSLDTFEGEISDLTQKKIIGPANKQQSDFKNKLEQITKKGGWETNAGPVKKVERATDKIINDYNGQLYELRDSLRGVVLISDPNDPAELAKIKKTVTNVFGGIERDKPGLDRPTGYISNMLNVEMKNGIVAEVQVTTPEMWDAKIVKGGDEMYKIVRAKAPGWEKVEKEMNALYQKARDDTKRRLAVS